MQEGTVFTGISNLGLCFPHRTLLLTSIQRICHKGRFRKISESLVTRFFRVTRPASQDLFIKPA